MRFDVTILGSNAATPLYNRNPSAQILNINERLFLVDCGEGTQQQLLRMGIRAQRIHSIFISHLHGDHYLGLVGLVSSLHLVGRNKPLTIYGPPELQEIVEMQLQYSQTVLNYPLIFIHTQADFSEIICENPDFSVETIILEHRIPCTGFLFRMKPRLRKINKDKIEELNIPVELIPMIKRGVEYTAPDGRTYTSEELTFPPDAPRSYAYCSDTLCNWTYVEQIRGVNTLYHESTFLSDMESRATDTYHTTAQQAAQVADKAGVEKLLLGHFSARYRELDPLLVEAKSVFDQSYLASEGLTFNI